MEKKKTFGDYSIDGSKKKRIERQVEDPLKESEWIREKTRAEVIQNGRQVPKRNRITRHFERVKPLLGSERIVSKILSLLPLRTTRSDSFIPYLMLMSFRVQHKINHFFSKNAV